MTDGEDQRALPIDFALLGLLKGWSIDLQSLDGEGVEREFVGDVIHRSDRVTVDEHLLPPQDVADVGAMLVAVARLDAIDSTLWSKLRSWIDLAAEVMCLSSDSPLVALHDEVRVHLLELGYRAGVFKDDRAVELMFSGFGRLDYFAAFESLTRVTEFCASRATDRAAIRWFTLNIAILDSMADEGEYESLEDFSMYGRRVLDAVSRCLEMMSGYPEPAPPECLAWVASHVLDFLRRTDLRCDSGLSVDDSWLGAVLYICDTLVLDGRIDDVMAILDRCAEVGDKARIAGDEIQGQKANPFRDDVPFLKALLARRRLS